MKKIILTLAVVFSVAAPAFANEVSIASRINDAAKYMSLTIPTDKNYHFNVENFDKANNYLKTDTATFDLMKSFYIVFSAEMTRASKIENTEERTKAVQNAIKYVESNAGKVIDKADERHRYFTLFNVTLLNHGFGNEIANR